MNWQKKYPENMINLKNPLNEIVKIETNEIENKVNKGNYVNYIISFESDELETDEIISLFSFLIKSHLVYQLQGFYGRTAKSLIESGFLTSEGEIL